MKIPKPLKTLLKLSLYTAIFLFVAFTVLARMGGNADVYKEAVEAYFAENTPYTAHIEKFNTMRFFPDIVVDMEGLTLRDPQTTKVAVRVDKLRCALGFFDMGFHRRRFKALDVQGISAQAGAFLSQSVYIDRMGFEEEGDRAFLKATGGIGQTPFSVTLDFTAHGAKGSRVYALPEDMPFEGVLGALRMKTTLARGTAGSVKLSALALENAGKPVLSGDFEVSAIKDGGGLFTGRISSVNKEALGPALDILAKAFDGDEACKAALRAPLSAAGDVSLTLPVAACVRKDKASR